LSHGHDFKLVFNLAHKTERFGGIALPIYRDIKI